jgi:hypothetical protein
MARVCSLPLVGAVRGNQRLHEKRQDFMIVEPAVVMAGLVPAIARRMRSIRPHAARLCEAFEVGVLRTAWMPCARPRLSGWSLRRRRHRELPPPLWGRESPHSTRCSNPSPQRRQPCRSSAISGLSKLRGFPQPDTPATKGEGEGAPFKEAAISGRSDESR